MPSSSYHPHQSSRNALPNRIDDTSALYGLSHLPSVQIQRAEMTNSLLEKNHISLSDVKKKEMHDLAKKVLKHNKKSLTFHNKVTQSQR